MFNKILNIFTNYRMVKMLRLTSDDVTGNFNGFLKQELDLKPNSKIALQSCVFEAADRQLIINAANDQVSFQTSNASGVNTITLAHTDGANGRPSFYDSTNLQLFFDDMNSKINSKFRIQNPSQIGQQFKLYVDQDGLIVADFQKGAYKAHDGTTDPSDNLIANIVKEAGVPVLEYAKSSNGSLGRSANTDGFFVPTNADCYKDFTYFSYPISKGCGLFRFRMNKFQELTALAGGTQKGGFTIALSERNPHTATTPFQLADIKIGIQALQATAGTASRYSVIIDGGTPTDTHGAAGTPNPNAVDGSTTAGSVNADIVELAIEGNSTGVARSLHANVYQRENAPTLPPAGTAATFDTYAIGESTYATTGEVGADLYGYIFLNGSKVKTANGDEFTCRLSNIRYTNDPFAQQASRSTDVVGVGVTAASDNFNLPLEGLGAIPQPIKNPNTNYFINFNARDDITDTSVSEWLGFRNERQPLAGFTNGKSVSFKAEDLFGSKIIADSFIVQMLNLPLQSYDMSETRQGRENILAVIPLNDEDLAVQYEANNLLYLDLENEYPIKLANLRMRILRHDYSPVRTRGLSSIVLVID